MKFYGDLPDRFMLEPRKDIHCCWLVVFDMAKQEYVKENPADKKCRRYVNFRNSTNAFTWLQDQVEKGNL